MGRRTWLDSDIWYDTRSLTKSELDLYLHLLINEGGNIAGYYKLNLRYLSADIQIGIDEIIPMLNKPTKYWVFDEQTEQVLIPRYTKYNIVKGSPQIKKLNAEISKLTPCRLDRLFMKAWVECNGIGAESLLDPKFRARCDRIDKELLFL